MTTSLVSGCGNGAPAGSQSRPRGGQPGNSNALKDGRYRRRRLLKAVDWRTQLDRRSAVYLELREREESLAAGAGGRENLSPQKLALLPTAAQVWLELDTLNHFIAQTGTHLIDKRRKALRPIVHDRNRQAMTLKALLEVIGLERLPKPVESLAEIVAEYASRRVPNERAEGTEGQP